MSRRKLYMVGWDRDGSTSFLRGPYSKRDALEDLGQVYASRKNRAAVYKLVVVKWAGGIKKKKD